MELILIQSVDKLGPVGHIVRVKNGYARNFLIPQGKAMLANDQNKKDFESRKAEIEQQDKEKIELAEKVLSKINNQFYVIVRQAGDDDRLYGSVSARDVALAATTKTNTIERSQVSLDTPIKYLGVHTVKIVLHPSVVAKINIIVARTEEDAENLKKDFLNPKLKESQEDNTTQEAKAEGAEEAGTTPEVFETKSESPKPTKKKSKKNNAAESAE